MELEPRLRFTEADIRSIDVWIGGGMDTIEEYVELDARLTLSDTELRDMNVWIED